MEAYIIILMTILVLVSINDLYKILVFVSINMIFGEIDLAFFENRRFVLIIKRP